MTAEPASPPATAEPAIPAPAAGWRDRVRPASLRQALATASIGTVAALGALGLIILGAAPMAAAQASPTADPILAEAIAGSAAPLNFAAKRFSSPTSTAVRSAWPACAAKSSC